MKRILLILTMALSVLGVTAKYTVHSVNGSVRIERAGQLQDLAKGVEVRGIDKIVVGNNSSVEILNSADTRVYRCARPGKYTTTSIMMNARKEANSKVGTIANAVRFGGGKSSTGTTIYEETCMVTRALETYDPEGALMQVDANQLAEAIAGRISFAEGEVIEVDSIPVSFVHGTPVGGVGLEFSIENTRDFPLYINVVKYRPDAEDTTVAISELGQPIGCYILLPGQSITRSHSRELSADYRHLIVLTHCYFDIDEVIEKTAEVQLTPGLPPLELPGVEIATL